MEHLKPIYRERLLANPRELCRRRKQLGSLSEFMKKLKWPVAWKANREDKQDGHFFEQRFYSGALLSQKAVLAAMAYVDLNPVRAKITRRLEDCQHTSIQERMRNQENSEERLKKSLEPLVSGLSEVTHRLSINLASYIELLNALMDVELNDLRASKRKSRVLAWYQRVAQLRKRDCAFGTAQEKSRWISTRDRHNPEDPVWDD